MSTRMDLVLTGTAFTDYHLLDAGAAAFQLAHDWFIKQDLVIRNAPAGGGTLLVEGVDYTLSTESLDDPTGIPGLSTRVTAAVGAGRNVYHLIAIINAAYQSGDLYFSGKYVGDSVAAIDHEARLVVAITGADYTILDDDDVGVLEMNPNGADRTATLPTAADNLHKEITIVNSAAIGTIYKIIVDGEGAELIDAVTTWWLYPGQSVTLKSNGTIWRVISGKGEWHRVIDPTTDWLTSKISGWTDDSFSGGLLIDFSGIVPPGTKAVLVSIGILTAGGSVYARAGGDTTVSNTPAASGELHARIGNQQDSYQRVMLLLSEALTAEIAISSTSQDIYVSYPLAYVR